MRQLHFLILFIITACSYAQTQLSDKAKISVITFGPSQDELYAAFGHSAVRVYDPTINLDLAYNYGMFDFNQPNFYLNFTRGHLLYKLGISSYPRMRDIYLYYNRWIHEQVLNLNPEQTQKVFEFLQWNAQPENRDYLYDYFYDNCATRIRDMFEKTLPDKIVFDGTFITSNYTIRDLTDIYLKHQPWGDLGIDICLGLPMDKKAALYEYMFLPDYIESSFHHATIATDSGSVSLVTDTIVTNPEQAQEITRSAPHPWIVFGIVLFAVAGMTFIDYKRKKTSRWLDAILFGATGLIGCLLFLLWVATDHKAAATNFNLLWALPTNMVAIVMLFGNRNELLKKYFGAASILTILLLIGWFFLPQQLNLFLIPIIVALGIRYAFNYWIRVTPA